MSKRIPRLASEPAKIRQSVIGVFHIEIQRLPQMPDETSRRYLFVAMDHATRWVYTNIYCDVTETRIFDFMRRMKLASPNKIVKILIDNGLQFTDWFITKNKKPLGSHSFNIAFTGIDVECRSPSQKGIAEHFIGRLNALLKPINFENSANRATTLRHYVRLHNTTYRNLQSAARHQHQKT